MEFTVKNQFSYMRRSRVAALQILYQLEFYPDKNFTDIATRLYKLYERDYPEKKVSELLNKDFIIQLVTYVQERPAEITELLEPELLESWDLHEISMILRLILFLAIAEFKQTDTDLAVIINEYIEITKAYENERDARFVNSILEILGKKIRNN